MLIASAELEISLFLLRRLLGVKTEDKKQTKVSKLVKNELLLINIGSTSTGGRVLSVKGDLAKIQLTSPACTEVGEKVALSRRIEKHWRLVGEFFRIHQNMTNRRLIAILRRMGKCTARDCAGGGLGCAVAFVVESAGVLPLPRSVALEACLVTYITHVRVECAVVSMLILHLACT